MTSSTTVTFTHFAKKQVFKTQHCHLIIYLFFSVTNSMEQSPSCKAKNVLSYSRNSPHFMEPEGSSPYSQQPATCPYPEPDRSRLCPHPTSRRSILVLSSHLRLGLPSGVLQSSVFTNIIALEAHKAHFLI
jgi:hypothetical protein